MTNPFDKNRLVNFFEKRALLLEQEKILRNSEEYKELLKLIRRCVEHDEDHSTPLEIRTTFPHLYLVLNKFLLSKALEEYRDIELKMDRANRPWDYLGDKEGEGKIDA